MATGDRIPIACTLGPSQWNERVTEWQAFRRSAVTDMETSGTTARLHLNGSDGALLAAVSLSQREKECCAFFDFAIEVEATDRWLVARVPSEAEQVLASFVSMLDAPAG